MAFYDVMLKADAMRVANGSTCPRCGAVYRYGVPHRHRVTVRVPIKRVVEGVTCDSFERVTCVVDVGDVESCIQRAVQRVHGADAVWIDGGRWHGPDRGCIGEYRHAARMHVHCDVPAPVVEWDGGDL